MEKTLFVILFIIMGMGNSLAQQASYYFKHYNINSGLSQNTVMGIFQDSKGFIWIGTKNGLNRFDGHDFKIYRRGDSPTDLTNSMVYCINEDSGHTLWIGTDKGISLYAPLTGDFSEFNVKTEKQESVGGCIYKILPDTQNRIWILSSDGLFLYKKNENVLLHLNDKFKEYTPAGPCAVYIDHKNMAYIGFPKIGILKYDIETDKVSFLCHNPHTPTVISDYKKGYLLLGTMNRGLFLVNKENGKSEKVVIDASGDSNIYVRDIKQISDTECWIGSESGIYILKDSAIQHITHEEFNTLSLSDNAIYSILKDREGGIWIGSYFGGVDYIPAQYSYFENFYPIAYKNSVSGYRVREFVNDEKGNLWIATEDNGLNYYDTSNGTFTHISLHSKPLSVSFTNIQCLNLANDKLWVGTFTRGIDVLDLKTKQCRHYEKTDKPHSLENNDIFAIYTDKRNTTWIGSTTGIYTYAPEIDGFEIFDKIKGVFVSDIWEDNKNNIWFATYNRGVIRYNPESGETKEFRYDKDNAHSLCYDRITGIYQDSRQRLWFSSEDGGFCLYNEKDDTFTRITIEQGLPSNVIYKIVEDDNQHLWLSTNNGLVNFAPETMTVEALYNLPNGLQSRQFNYNSGIKNADGTLYFGSINGFIAFNPKNFRPNNNKYSVILTGLYIFNQEITAGKDSDILKEAIPYADQIKLNYDQSTFSFSFSALNYSTEGSGKYAYKLEGLDKKWTYVDNISRVSYNSIPPGNYTFRIKYSKDGHTGSDGETQVKIKIIPPIWQTTWAYILYALIIIGILFILIRLYTLKKKKQVEEKLAHQEQEKKEEIYKAKIDFFTNIAHEIRTPITLIKAPLDYIIHSQPDEHEIKENLVTMERNTDRLLVLVNQLLDFRKIESKAFTLSLKTHDVRALVTNTFNRFVPAAKQRNLTTNLECSSHSVMALIDEEAITKVCSNLFNNAIKYASTYIKVTLSESEDMRYFQITVKNDGKPIPVDLRQSIFEAFFQIKESNQPAQPGSGIGLTLASSLVQLHHGKLYLDDKAEDTSFVVQIPKNVPADTEHTEIKPSTGETEEDISFTTPETLKSGKETILIVEDNDELRSFLLEHLGKYYQVTAAGNGVEAIEVLKKQIINLIVSDVMMPLMDGLELCKSIKSDIETCHIPIILLTAKTTLQNRIEGLKTGADAYIEKPFAMPHLLVQIGNLLESRMKLRQNFANNPYIATNSIAQNKADEDFLNKLTEIIKQNLEEENFNIDNLASEMNMSRTSLHRKIKGITELTPGDFIRLIRLKKAAELLLQGEYRINEICMLVGIQSLSYFSKCFQKQFGVLPKDFAKSHANKP